MALPSVNDFGAYLAGFCGKATIGAYLSAARRFIAANSSISSDSLVKHVGMCASAGLMPATISVQIAALKHLIELSRIRGFDVPEKITEPKLPRIRLAVAPTMNADEMALFDDLCCEIEEPQSTLMRILPLTGMRISEACGLTVSDLAPPSEAGGSYVIAVKPNSARTVKGKSDREVVALRWATGILDHYCLHTFPKLRGFRGSASVWLFPDHRGRPMPRRRVAASFARIGEKMGRQLSAHASRHAHATLLSEAGWSVAAISEQLGHENASTTLSYIAMSVEKRRELMSAMP